MASNVITAPATAPVTLTEAKQTLLIDHAADDALITQLIDAATREVETLAARSLVTQTREMVLDRWPGVRFILLEYPPVQSITAITYVTAEGVTVTLANTDYQLIADVTPPLLWPGEGGSWPAAALRSLAPIRVRYVAGYGAAAAVPPDFKRLILGLVAVDYENRESMNQAAFAQRLRVQAACKMQWGYAT